MTLFGLTHPTYAHFEEARPLSPEESAAIEAMVNRIQQTAPKIRNAVRPIQIVRPLASELNPAMVREGMKVILLGSGSALPFLLAAPYVPAVAAVIVVVSAAAIYLHYFPLTELREALIQPEAQKAKVYTGLVVLPGDSEERLRAFLQQQSEPFTPLESPLLLNSAQTAEEFPSLEGFNGASDDDEWEEANDDTDFIPTTELWEEALKLASEPYLEERVYVSGVILNILERRGAQSRRSPAHGIFESIQAMRTSWLNALPQAVEAEGLEIVSRPRAELEDFIRLLFIIHELKSMAETRKNPTLANHVTEFEEHRERMRTQLAQRLVLETKLFFKDAEGMSIQERRAAATRLLSRFEEIADTASETSLFSYNRLVRNYLIWTDDLIFGTNGRGPDASVFQNWDDQEFELPKSNGPGLASPTPRIQSLPPGYAEWKREMLAEVRRLKAQERRPTRR